MADPEFPRAVQARVGEGCDFTGILQQAIAAGLEEREAFRKPPHLFVGFVANQGALDALSELEGLQLDPLPMAY